MKGISFEYCDAGLREDRKLLYARFKITTDEHSFDLEETLTFPAPLPDSREVASLLKAIHLALGMSYYKAFIPPKIIHPYFMDVSEAAFWNTVFHSGFGEFVCKNQLSFEQLAGFSAQDGIRPDDTLQPCTFDETILLGLGGGKDSIVAGELLKAIGMKVTGFVQATGEMLGQTQAVADVMELPLVAIERRIDPKIIEINALPGALNGHIPVSLLFALTGCLQATAMNSKFVVVANESSASLPQTNWQGQPINHQWSKSLEFETLLQRYLQDYVSDQLTYFSAIRPLSSVAVMKLFSEMPQYFEVFTSDNSLFALQKTDRPHPRWSPESSKTLSSCILLAPWVDPGVLPIIFGADYLNDERQLTLLQRLLGSSDNIVLDCVGTPRELRSCMRALSRNPKYSSKKLVSYAKEHNLTDTDGLESFLTLQEHAYPPALSELLIVQLNKSITNQQEI